MLALLLSASTLSGPAIGSGPQADGMAASSEIGNGLYVSTFEGRLGRIEVMLPTDFRAGDQVSGRVVTTPSGASADARRANETLLQAHRIEVAGVVAPVRDGQVELTIPGDSDLALTILVQDRNGRTVASGPYRRPPEIGPEPYRPRPPPSNVQSGPGFPTDPNGPEPYRLYSSATGALFPYFAMAGKPMLIRNAPGSRWAGKIGELAVQARSQNCAVLAASPVSLVALVPIGQSGACEFVVRERSVELHRSNVQVLSYRLSSPSTTLAPGQSTIVTARVGGFLGAPAAAFPCPFFLRNDTPRIASFSGVPGKDISHWIHAAEVDSKGEYTYSVGLVGQTAGRFVLRGGIFAWSWKNPWSSGSNPTPRDYLDDKGKTNPKNPYAKCAFLITVGPGTNPDEVPHSAVSIDGTVYSFEGNGMNAYLNVGAYINKRRLIDGREVTVNPIPDADKPKMLEEVGKIMAEATKYHVTTNNCALIAWRLIRAGAPAGRDILEEPHPNRLRDRNEDSGALGPRQKIEDKQIE